MEISLAEGMWQVKGYWPYVPIKETSMELGQKLKGITDWIDAEVPGGVHYDLYRAGMIENPWFGRNSLKCEWVENRWWMYRTHFKAPEGKQRKTELVFEGLDYEVEGFLNDESIFTHKGMYEPVVCDITGLLQEENILLLLFKGVPKEMGQIGYTSLTSTQKSRFNYKWDFSTRLVNIGIWQDVKLRIWDQPVLKEPYVTTEVTGGIGLVSLRGVLHAENGAVLSGTTLRLLLREERGDGGTGVPAAEGSLTSKEDGSLEGTISVMEPKLWFPNGMGEQPLYRISLLSATGILVYEQVTGIRRLVLQQNDDSPEDALPYTFVVNGRRMYVKGVNITPLDHLYGNVTKAQYRHLVEVCVNANVNLLRVWGGGLIEKEWLYEYCDRAGIFIWQEFIQSSSGIDNKPCEDEEFLRLLARNAKAAIVQKRNHVSLAAWSGGNELTETENAPCGYDNQNIAMLNRLVETYDKTRFFFPTSASGPREFVSLEQGVSHDVHESWQYEGNPYHYEKYGSSDHLFHSEFGMDGTCCVRSMKKFLEPKDLYPTPMSGNQAWQHHGEWWGTYDRDKEIFGSFTELTEFVSLSQYMQAEGLRFMIEADRRRKYHASGSVIWQLNEPWPNASCTNLMDYYGELKPAYYYAKNSYATYHASAGYRSLWADPSAESEFPIFLHNSGGETELRVTAEAIRRNGKVLGRRQWTVRSKGDCAQFLGNFTGIWEFEELLFLRLRVYRDEKLMDENVYVFGASGKGSRPVLQAMRGLRAEPSVRVLETMDEEYGYVQTLLVCNKGGEAAVQTGVTLLEDRLLMYAEDNYFFLFPGESKQITIHVRDRDCGGFLKEYNGNGETKRAGVTVSCL